MSDELTPIDDGDVHADDLPGPVRYSVRDYRAERSLKRDNTRKWLAGGAVLHLFLLEGLSLYVLRDDTEALTNRLNLLITTASGITGVVLGFYFGQSND